MFRRRRPLARAALIGGGAYAIGKNRARAEADDAAAAEYAAVPDAPAGGLSEAAIDQLAQLGKLKEQGILTEDEFEEQKRKLLRAS